MKTILTLYKFILSIFIAPLLWIEYRKPLFRSPNERPNEYEFVFRCIQAISPKTILDVGCGIGPLPAIMANCGIKVTATDNKKWNGLFFNHHYHVIKDDITATKLTGRYDLVTCISVLEHIPDYGKALQNLLKLGDYVILTFPYAIVEIPDVYEGSRSYFTRAFSRNVYKNLNVIDIQFYRCWSGDYWGQGERGNFKGQPDLVCILIKS